MHAGNGEDPGRALEVSEFLRIEMRVGRVLSAEPNLRARKPAYVMKIDFGPTLGIRTTSAQITQNYEPAGLIGRLVVAVVNFSPKNVAGVTSEVLVLAAVDDMAGTVLLSVDRDVGPGTRIL